MASMYNFPDDPKKIRARIRSYERKLVKSLMERWPDDGAGKRYLLGPLYLLMGDNAGALASFRWYEKAFPDDCGEAAHFLCWSLALLRGGEEEGATRKLKRAMFENFLIVPRLLDLPDPAPDLYESDGWDAHQQIPWIPDKIFSLWTPVEKAWALKKYEGEAFQWPLKRFLEIERLLKTEKPGRRRTALCNESWALIDGLEKGKP